jgi:hypothetical protein
MTGINDKYDEKQRVCSAVHARPLCGHGGSINIQARLTFLTWVSVQVDYNIIVDL